jgi:hypothetical protein
MSSTSIYHYAYRISNRLTGMHYYGVRSSKGHPKLDLGVKYFSSLTGVIGKTFKTEQRNNPENYKYKVIKICSSRELAVKFEIRLHSKFNVKKHPKFLNRSNQTTEGFDAFGNAHSEEAKNKMRVAAKSRPEQSEETKKKRSNSLTGKPKSEEHRRNLIKSQIGKKRPAYSETARLNMARAQVDETIYKFVNRDGSEFVGTGYDLGKLYKLQNNSIRRVIKGTLKTTGGWMLEI